MSSCGTSRRGGAAVMTLLTLARPEGKFGTLGADAFADHKERAGATPAGVETNRARRFAASAEAKRLPCAAARSAGGSNTTTCALTARRRAPGRPLLAGFWGCPGWPVNDGAIKLRGPAEEFELPGGYGRQWLSPRIAESRPTSDRR